MLPSLFDAGLITMQESGNYKRYPIRNGDGEITDGCSSTGGQTATATTIRALQRG